MAPVRARPRALLDEFHALTWSGPRTSLRDLEESRSQDLPEFASFLPAWISALKRDRRPGFEAEVRRLLCEAVQLKDGLDGLLTLARERGVKQPEVYLELVMELEEVDHQRAIAAAREALAAPVPSGDVRAQIADRLVGLVPDAAERVDASRQAWQASPSAPRLAMVAQAAIQAGLADPVLASEAERVAGIRGDHETRPTPRLIAALQVLARLLDEAVDQARRAKREWGSSEHPVSVVIPSLLAAATGCRDLSGSAIAACFAGIDQESRHAQQWGLRADSPDADVNQQPGAGESLSPRLTDMIRQRLSTAWPQDDREHWLADAKELTLMSVASVLGATQRHSYQRVARYVAACGAAIAINGGSGDEFVAGIVASYPRHVAFRRELENTRGESKHRPRR
ncbi:MAG: hypothetical protein ACYDGR_11710 [Candidatus Dormibacteria bacterium]